MRENRQGEEGVSGSESVLAEVLRKKEEALEKARDALRVAAVVVTVLQGRIVALEAKLRTDKTGIHSEEGFREFMEERRAQGEHGQSLVLMYVDANHFKEINDDKELGHEAGDAVIQEIGDYLKGIGRAEDVVARLHGDEFVIVFVGATEEGLAKKFADKKFAFTAHYKGKEIPVTLAAGIAVYQEEEAIEEALGRADAAMRASKKKGDGSVARYSDD